MYVSLVPSGDQDGELSRAPAGAVTSVVLLPAMSIDSIRAPAELVPLTAYDELAAVYAATTDLVRDGGVA